MKLTYLTDSLARILCVLALSLLLLNSASAAWVERLTNGGFESNFNGWNSGHGQVETTHVYEGSKSARIVSSFYFKQFYQTIPFTEGRIIQADGWVKAVDVNLSVSIQILFLNSAGNVISQHGVGSATGTTDFLFRQSAQLTSPAGTANVRLRCIAGTDAGGTGYFDGLSLRELTGPDITYSGQQTVEQISNPGFENAFSGWQKDKASLDTTNPRSGVNAARLQGSTYFKSFRYRQAASAGEVYSASLWAKCTNLPVGSGINLRFMSATDAEIDSHSIAGLRGSREYRKYELGNVMAPVGTAFVELRMTCGAGNSGGNAYFDDFSLRKNTGLPIDAVPTFESAGLTVLTTSTDADCTFYYREQGASVWKQAIAPYFAETTAGHNQFRCSIVDLAPDTTYQVYAYVMDGETILAEGGTSFTTWAEEPPVGANYTVAQLYSSGKLTISELQGTPEAWIKITGTGSNDVNAAYATDEAVHLYNCAYVIFENVQITGGRRHGIHVEYSESIRIRNCDVSGWAREPNYVSGGLSYETQADVTADQPINMDAGLFLDSSVRVTLERSYLHDPRLSASNWDHGHPVGPTGIAVNGGPTTGNFVVRYNDIIGSDTVRWNDGIEGYGNNSVHGSFARDSDIHGNMLSFGQDDAIELDGGQENVRFFGNKIHGFLCGISVAPNTRGPSYLYRNLVARLGDSRNVSGAIIKQGGGSTYSRGMTYLFNNTLYSSGYGGICGVGFGSDTNRDLYHAITRNNIVYGLGSNLVTIEDVYDLATNDFDYDNLWNVGRTTANTDIATWQEPNGTKNAAPQFVSADDDDFRLATGSPGIDAGTLIPSFMENWVGSAPDQGAFEGSVAQLFPERPIAITANRYRVALTATAGGSSGSATVTLTTGAISGSTAYTVKKNSAAGWLNVNNATGTLGSHSTKTFTVSVNTAGLTAGTKRRGVFLVRLNSTGYSVPVVVEATIN